MFLFIFLFFMCICIVTSKSFSACYYQLAVADIAVIKEMVEFVMYLCSDVNKIREGIGDKVANVLQWTGCFIVGLVIGVVYGWKLALVIIAVSPLLGICGWLMTYVSA